MTMLLPVEGGVRRSWPVQGTDAEKTVSRCLMERMFAAYYQVMIFSSSRD